MKSLCTHDHLAMMLGGLAIECLNPDCDGMWAATDQFVSWRFNPAARGTHRRATQDPPPSWSYPKPFPPQSEAI